MKAFDDQKIDDFLLGQMGGDELQEFKNQIAMDKNFAHRVNQRKEALQYINILGDLDLKKRVSKLHKDAVKNLPKEKTFSIIPILKYAAVVALLIVAGYWFFQSSLSGSDIYNSHYQAYELNFGDRGDASEDIITVAGQLYATGNYQQALDQFNTLSPEAVTAKVTLAKGISYLETGDYQNASAAFQQLIDQQDLIYEDHGRWYLAMTYFKEGKTAEAKTLIEQIANKANSFNQQKAKEILSTL